MIDPAILRAGRLDKKYFIGTPDKDARKALFKLYLEKRPYDFGIDYDELAVLTHNYVSADIQLIVNDASREALKLRSKISMKLLIAAIKGITSSLSIEEINRYDDIKDKMESKLSNKQNNERPRIGFK